MRTGGIVDMFLTAILRTGTKNDYLFRFLVPPGTRKHIAPHMSAFKAMNLFELSPYNHTLGEGSKGFIVLLYQICERDRLACYKKPVSRFAYRPIMILPGFTPIGGCKVFTLQQHSHELKKQLSEAGIFSSSHAGRANP